MLRTVLGFGGVVALAAWLGCGGEQAAKPSGPPLAGGPAQAAAPADRNRPPEIRELRFEPPRPAPGQRVRAVAVVADPDGEPVEVVFRWKVNGVPQRETGDTLSLEGVRKGALVEVEARAADARAALAERRASLRVGNRPPLLHSVVLEPLGEPRAGTDLTAVPRAVDPDGDPLRYEFRWWVNGSPVDDARGGTLDARHFRRGDEIEVEVVASDGESRSERLRSGRIRVANAPPRFVSRPAARPAEGRLEYQLVAEDPDGDATLRYRLLRGPRGMRLDPVLGRLTWDPQGVDDGVYEVEVEVDDLQGGTARQTFQVSLATEVVPANAAP